jgi:flagellar biosynthesis protein FliP
MTRYRFFLSGALALVTGWAAFLYLTDTAAAQTLSLDMGEGGGDATARLVQIIALVTVVSLAPAILVMVTSFTRIVIVLSFVRTAMGTQQTPPNQVLVSLALFLTAFVMMPTFETSYDQGIRPLIEGEIDEFEAFERSVDPLRGFMMRHVREEDLTLFADLSGSPDAEIQEKVSLRILAPAFMISELRRAFEIGFLIFVPFLIIDMVVASILMSMGMMMLPPIIIALPFKIIFFVLVDGWHMVVGSLVRSFGG